jgi:hypothetical protein
MPISLDSHQLAPLLPALRAGVRTAHLRRTYADDALQRSLVALAPHLERLVGLTERERSAYAFMLGARTAMGLRKRVGFEVASGTDAEVDAWHRRTIDAKREQQLSLGLKRSASIADNLETCDRELLRALRTGGSIESDAISHRSLAHGLRHAREALGRAWQWVAARMRDSR